MFSEKKLDSKHGEKDKVSAIISMLPSKQYQNSQVGMSKSRQSLAKRRQSNRIYPEKTLDSSELGDLGIQQKYIENEEEQWKALVTIKSLPCNMKRKREIKNKLFEKPVKPVKGCDAWKYRRRQSWRKFKISLKELGYKLELWRSWFKRIEGHQGTGVLSYFVFLKWILFLNVYLFLLIFGFIIIPTLAFPSAGYTTQVLGSSGSTSNTATCSVRYNLTYATSGASVIQDFIQGSGWMEKTGLFYGWFDAVELNLGTTGGKYFNYLMPFAYFMTSLGVLFLSLVRMARFTIASFKENLEDSKDHRKTDYCNKVFGGWDYALDNNVTCIAKTKSIYKDIVANLDHQKYTLTRSSRSAGQKCRVYTIRFLINILILGILGGAGYLIYWVNDWSTSYLSTSSSSGSVLVLLISFLPSLTITILNVIIPLIFEILVKAEDYTEDMVVKLTLIRTVFLRLASLAVLMVSLYVNITCSTKDSTCNVGTGTCTEIRCWETYVGQAFYKLMVMDFLVHIVVIFLYELPRKLFTTKCSCKICGKIGPAEFNVSGSVLDLVYTQALCWIGFLYCPLITACAVISTFTQFYLKLLSALFTTVPPNKPYKASKSNNFFMVVLMVTFFLCCFPVGYSMVKLKPSTGCGPFRIYSDMSICVNTTIETLPSWLQGILTIITSTSFIICLLTVLCLIIYYLYVRGKAHYARAEVMKEQLVMEGKDKQFLLAKIHEFSGDGPKPKAQPKPRIPPPQVQTINEVPSEQDTKKLIDNNVPPPPAYDANEQPAEQTFHSNEAIDDWGDKPVELVVVSPPSEPTLIPEAKQPKKSNLKARSRVSPAPPTEDNAPRSNMPFDF